MSSILCTSDFELQRKLLEKFKSNRATKNRFVAVNRRFFACSPVPHLNFLRPESYRSAAIRNTEGGPFLMLRFQVCPFIRYVRIQRVDVCDVSRSALSLDMLEIQRWDHFLCYVSRSAFLFDMLEIQRTDDFLYCVLRFARK